MEMMMTQVFQNGEKMAKVTENGEGFMMSRGIVGDETDGGFQVFASKSYTTARAADRAALKWIYSA
jgi:hypothetical protein